MTSVFDGDPVLTSVMGMPFPVGVVDAADFEGDSSDEIDGKGPVRI